MARSLSFSKLRVDWLAFNCARLDVFKVELDEVLEISTQHKLSTNQTSIQKEFASRERRGL